MALVKFVSCTAAKYIAATKDADTLYFVTDTHQLYKGEEAFTGLFETVTADPASETAAQGVTYVNTTTGRVTFFNGTSIQELVPAKATVISGAGDNAHVATTKAVVDYVKANSSAGAVDALAERVTTVEGNVTSLQGDMTTLKGDASTTGSVAEQVATAKTAAIDAAAKDATSKADKALEDAKSYADGLNETLTETVNGKADKATTLAGYGIADAYTKDEANTAIAKAVNEAGHLKRSIVDALPAVGEADEHTIYMVPKQAGVAGNESGNSYVEYMLVNGKFEQVGDSTVDLTDYAKTADVKGDIATAKSEAIAAAAEDAKGKIEALDLTDAAVAGQYVSAVSQKDGQITVTRAALPVDTLETGSANGTVAFNGKDVSVKGLGSAAYTAADAYATAAQGANADAAIAALTWTTL